MKTNTVNPKNESLRYILFWTKFFETENWGMGKKVLGEEFLKSLQCSVTNCIFSHDRGLLSSPADYDALIFHVGEPFDIYDLPATRSENQIYAMLNQERPIYTWHNFEHDKGFFNMTVTYRQDSDVYFGYSKMVEISSNLIVSPSKQHVWREPETVNDPQILNLIASKSKMAAWFVSRCGAFSNRDNLVKQLQQYIDVDVYGKCGLLKCPRDNQNQCLEMLNTTYKFYLALENSICVDYITEKTFLNMQNFIIPIVYNGVTDMHDFLPPHSFININDYKSIEELANYLKFLDENPQEYANYFWWKKYYKIYGSSGYCDLCMKLKEWDLMQKKQQHLDIAHWWNHKTCRDTSKDFL
ncbi:unnamed protein product [Chironomus riparius]|uniref:Fucosyltransferase n=1 Tax=Chironomus riparius TaxID=315576 RepID=A0A9N9WZX8_9DIPT|nr:unnamed protein product [Chironomus riparius]